MWTADLYIHSRLDRRRNPDRQGKGHQLKMWPFGRSNNSYGSEWVITMERKILVIGATGHQGGSVIDALSKTDLSVRAMVHRGHRDKARELEARGMEVMEADLDDLESLIHAMNGVHGIFSALNFRDGGAGKEEERGKRVADAAKEANVQHLIYSSVGGADRHSGVPHFESKWQVEEHIRNVGIPHSIVRPTTFMTNLMETPEAMRTITMSMISTGARRRPVQMIAVPDIGRWVAHMFQERDRFLGKAIEITGDELDQQKMMAAYRDVYGRTPETPVPTPVPWLNADFEKMIEWIDLHGYKADIEMNRREIPGLLTYEKFLALKRPM